MRMKQETFNFLSSDGKTYVYADLFLPETEKILGIVQIVHGMIEHIGRYEDFATFLTKQGFIAVGHDHLGHGRTALGADPEHPPFGYIGEDPHPSRFLVRDIHLLRMQMQEKYPELPYFIFGHSMGSFLLRDYLSVYGEGLAGAMICGSGYVPAQVTVPGLAVIDFFRKRYSETKRSAVLDKLAFSSNDRRFDMTGADPENNWLTKVPSVVTEYYNDPFSQFTFTANGYRALVESAYHSGQMRTLKKIPKDLPIFVLSGADDPVGGFGKGIRTFYRKLHQAGLMNLTLRLYENDRHELLNETDKEQVQLDLLDFLLINLPVV